MEPSESQIGPLLYARGTEPESGRHALSVLIGLPEGADPPNLSTGDAALKPEKVDAMGGFAYWRADFTLPARGGVYTLGTRRIPVHLADATEDARIAFVSCNGKETGDFDRPPAEREAMWMRLARAHRVQPFSLLIHGGDQIYADAALEAHPDLARWSRLPPAARGQISVTPEMEAAAEDVFRDRWHRSVTSPAVARLMEEVPSAAMWDDHDIFDGFGSHPAPIQESPVGQMFYRVARRFFDLFQAGGHKGAPATLTRSLPQPGYGLLIPDLRSERREDRVMGPAGWAETEKGFRCLSPGAPLFVLSTVPALGPRLSLVERLHRIIPGAQRYEDDLRDQWQSRAHRQEWQRFLRLAAERATQGAGVTFLSGEIHLASRAEMRTPLGVVLHQLTASGISHPPPPPTFARALGALAALGETPLKDHPISIRPLPGGTRRYVAERNYLLLERRSGQWRAQWELEESGATGWLQLGPSPAGGAWLPLQSQPNAAPAR